jgi:hypothetical protein
LNEKEEVIFTDAHRGSGGWGVEEGDKVQKCGQKNAIKHEKKGTP